MHLEFLESVSFADRVDDNQGLGASIVDLIQNAPNAGIAICPGIWELTITYLGQHYALIHGRKGNRVSLMYIFYLPDEEHALEKQKMEIKKLRCPTMTEGTQPKKRSKR